YQKLTMLEIGVQTAFAHTTIVWLTNGLVMTVNNLTLSGSFHPSWSICTSGIGGRSKEIIYRETQSELSG
ncbi:MAG: hypothetical protein ABI177_04705, partial [Edaphobacter sp.]